MNVAARVAVSIIALLHVYFLVLEMFLWATPFGQKTFGRTKAEQEATLVMAKNQGLYNGFLAAGLVWSATAVDVARARELGIFFLACVLVAGLYGGATAAKKILYVQALPALVALALVILGG